MQPHARTVAVKVARLFCCELRSAHAPGALLPVGSEQAAFRIGRLAPVACLPARQPAAFSYAHD
jgi:hypothetical protein